MSETDKEFVADMEWLHSHDREAALPPEKLARLFALARRVADAADEIERLRAELLERDAVWLPEKDAEIERLRAEVSALNHAEVKLLVQVDEQDDEIERLRAALKTARPFIGWAGHYPTILAEIDAALKEDGDE